MSRNNVRYAVLQMTFWTAAAAAYGFVTQILQDKGVGNEQIGVLNAVKLFSTLAVQIGIGSFCDRHAGTIPLKAVVAVLAAIAAILTGILYKGLSSKLGMILLFAGLGGTFPCISPLMDSMAVRCGSSQEPIQYAWCRAAGSAAYAVAGMVFGLFCDRFGVSRLLLVQMAATALIGLAALGVPEPMDKVAVKKKTGEGQTESWEQVHHAGDLLRMYPRFAGFLLGSALMFMGYNLGTTFLINVMEELGAGNTEYGMAEFVLAVSEIPAAFWMTRYRSRIPMDKLMISCAFFMMLKNVLAAYSGSVAVIILSQSCEMLGFGMYYSGSLYLVEQLLPKQDVIKGMSFVQAATVGLGEGIGFLLCGWIRNQWGLHGLMQISVLVSAFSIVGMVWMCRLPAEKQDSKKRNGVIV